MEEEDKAKQEEALEKKADEITTGKIGKPDEKTSAGIYDKVRAERLADEKALKEMREEREKMQKTMAEMALAGRAHGAQPKILTQEEKDQEEANKLIKKFYPY